MPERIAECCDDVARREVADVRHELRNHKAVAEIKAENLKKEVDSKAIDVKASIDEVRSLMKWAGSLIITLIIGVLGWSLVQQYQANEQQKNDLEQQLRLLQEQDQARAITTRNTERLDDIDSAASRP